MGFLRNLLFAILALPAVSISYCFAYIFIYVCLGEIHWGWMFCSGGALFPIIYRLVLDFTSKVATSKDFVYMSYNTINVLYAITLFILLLVDDNVDVSSRCSCIFEEILGVVIIGGYAGLIYIMSVSISFWD